MYSIIDKSAERFKEGSSLEIPRLQSEYSRSTIPSRDTSVTTAVTSNTITLKMSDYIKMKTNPVQKLVLDFLRPLNDACSNQLIEGILLVWMDKKTIQGNIHQSLEKIM